MSNDPPFRWPTDAEFEVARETTKRLGYLRRGTRTGRVAALDQLHETLVNNAQLFQTGEIQNQRDSVAHSLLAVMTFLDSQGFSTLVLSPLLRPVLALAERENGSVDMLFAERARKKGGRPKATLTQHERTGILAALAEAWLAMHKDSELPQAQKLEQCARKLKGRWFGKVTRAQLKTALDLVRQEGKDHPAVGSARITLAGYQEGTKQFGPTVAFEILIRTLNDLKLPFGAGEGGIAKTPSVSPSEGM